MINYIYAVLADIFFASGFTFQKKYQLKAGDTIKSGNVFNFLTGVFLTVIFFILCGFTPEFTAYSFIMAASQALIVLSYTLISFVIIKRGSLSLYMIFLMTGGMIVPYVWGILFLKEAVTLLRIIGIILITASIAAASFEKKKTDIICIALCIAVFFINGMSSVLSKIHQIQTDYPIVGETDFVFWSNVLRAVICFVVLLFTKGGITKEKPKGLFFVFLSALSSGIASFCNLKGAVNIPATVLYPLITGGTIILSYVAERIVFKEKVTFENLLPVIICFAGTLMFL